MAEVLQRNPQELEDPCMLCMGNLSSYMDEAFIRSAFRARNFELVTVRLIKDIAAKGTTHRCVVQFTSADIAKSALQNLNHQPIPGCGDGTMFELNWASKSRSTDGEEHNLYVGNLSAEVDSSELLEFFQTNYPSVISAKVMSDVSGSSQGFGYVKFLDADERDRSIAELDGLTIVGTKPVTMRTAEPPEAKSSGLDAMQRESPAVYAYGGYVYGTKTNHERTHYHLGPVSLSNSYAAICRTGHTGSPETPVNAKQVAHGSVANAAASSGSAYNTTINGGHTQVPFASLDITNAELIAQEKRLFEIMQEAKWDLQFNRKILAASTMGGLYKH